MKLIDLVILNENRNATWFHNISITKRNLNNLEKVIDGGPWIAYTDNPVPARKRDKGTVDERGVKDVTGTSFTRDRDYAKQSDYGSISIEFDPRKIKQRNRSVPIDWHQGGREASEEFVIGDIKNAGNMIVSITVRVKPEHQPADSDMKALSAILAKAKKNYPSIKIHNEYEAGEDTQVNRKNTIEKITKIIKHIKDMQDVREYFDTMSKNSPSSAYVYDEDAFRDLDYIKTDLEHFIADNHDKMSNDKFVRKSKQIIELATKALTKVNHQEYK